MSGDECLGEAGQEMLKHCNGISVPEYFPEFSHVSVSYQMCMCPCMCVHDSLCI